MSYSYSQVLFSQTTVHDQECLFRQTEIPGVQNAHGLKEGWAWLARFLNALPANIYTAVALIAFLQVSCCRYLMKFYK